MRYLIYFLIYLLFTGCSTTSSRVGEFFQTNGAKLIQRDYKNMNELLISLKKKLDARNPHAYNKKQDFYIYKEIRDNTNSLFYQYKGNYIKDYDKYLKIAFSKDTSIKYRNDFLILGLHKLLYQAYKQSSSHHLTTLGYDPKEFQKLYYYLQVINWKLKTDKDDRKHYLFLTWQKNWQIELQEDKSKAIKNLSSIRNKKETIFEPSNFSFEIIFNQMFFHVKNSARIVGEEPLDLSISAMSTFVLFL
jgi:hypothetical protein